jgi:hypothetical protein
MTLETMVPQELRKTNTLSNTKHTGGMESEVLFFQEREAVEANHFISNSIHSKEIADGFRHEQNNL